MSQHPHDQYAKEYLADLLDEVAKVQLGYEVLAESRRVDVYVEPRTSAKAPDYQALGMLGRMTRQTCLLEPFRNPPPAEEVCQCLGKLFAVWHRLQLRQLRQKLPPLSIDELPSLWILSPTASKSLINGFGGQLTDEWGEGIHWLPSHFKTAIVAIHQLPNTPETALLRVLGKGTKQTEALLELLKPSPLPADDPKSRLQQRIRSVLHSYLLWLKKQASSSEEQEILMSLLALHEEWERETLWRGRQEGRQEGQVLLLNRLLEDQFGPLDPDIQKYLYHLDETAVLECVKRTFTANSVQEVIGQ